MMDRLAEVDRVKKEFLCWLLFIPLPIRSRLKKDFFILSISL